MNGPSRIVDPENYRAFELAHKLLDERDAAANESHAKRNGKAPEKPFRPFIIGRTCDQITPQQVRFLWPGRIPFGRLTVMAGAGGLGKSWTTTDTAARFSTGVGWPDAPHVKGEQGFTLIMNSEDDPEDTIVPRLIDAGADLAQIKIIEGVQRHRDDDPAYPSLEDDIGALTDEIRATGATLLIVDPITAFLPSVDSHRDAAIRSILGPLARMAGDTGCAVVSVMHRNKAQGGSVADRVTGSPAFTNAARMAYFVGEDPSDPTIRIVAAFKCNVGPKPPSLRFQIAHNERTGRGDFRWLAGPCDVTADQLILAGGKDGKSAVDAATEWLENELFTGRMECEGVKIRARKAGHSAWALKQARGALEVRSEREGFGNEGKWYWSLPIKVEENV